MSQVTITKKIESEDCRKCLFYIAPPEEIGFGFSNCGHPVGVNLPAICAVPENTRNKTSGLYYPYHDRPIRPLQPGKCPLLECDVIVTGGVHSQKIER
jgi:hypothetical protein